MKLTPENGQASEEVTPEMIESGAYQLRECCYGAALNDVLEGVYRAMEHARRDQSGNAVASESILSR